MATVVVRHRRAVGAERDRTRWLLWSVEVGGVALALSLLTGFTVISDVVLFVVAVLPAVAVTIGIVRPTLVPVQDLLNGTLVFALLSLSLVVVDLLVVAGLSAVLDDSLDERQVVVVVLLLTIVLYGPLRQRLSATVRRLVLGQREAPYDVVAGLASTLERADEGVEQLAAVTDAVAAAFGIGFVRLEVDRANGERMTATHGAEPAEVRTLPITYREQEVGRVVLPVRGLRSRLSRRDEQLLGDLVRQAASAARTGQLAEELQESRERLVVAREEERRRIRRDLHDGLGPSLSGVVYQLESARLLVDKDPGAVRRILGSLSEHVQEIVADVRRLVHDLRPPALDDRGLVGALAQQAEQITDTGGPVVTVRGRRPRSAPGRGRGGGVPDRQRGPDQRRPPRRRPARAGRAGARRRQRPRRGRRRRHGHRRRGTGRRRAGVVAGAGRRAGRPQRGHLSAHRRDARTGLAARCRRKEPACADIRVVVVDDHAIVRDGLVALLGALDGVEVVGSAEDGRQALHVVDETTPDVVVMDIQMPHLDGIEATRFITGRHPEVRVVMLTMNEDDETVLSAIRAGASGYLLKGSGAEEVPQRRPDGVGGGHGLRRRPRGAGGVVLRHGTAAGPRAGRAVPRPHGPRARRPRAARLRQQQRRHRPGAVRLGQDRAQHRQLDLHQAARRRPRRGDRQGARGGVRPR